MTTESPKTKTGLFDPSILRQNSGPKKYQSWSGTWTFKENGTWTYKETKVTSKVAKTKNWTKEKIMELNRDKVFELWKKCPAAKMEELVGEYNGLVPNAGDPERKKAIDIAMYSEDAPSGFWLGKAFWPLSKANGEGYNRYRYSGRLENRVRFATYIGNSLIDGKPAFMMDYGAYHARGTPPGYVSDLIDEVRKLEEGVFVAMATRKNPDGSRTTPAHFVLVGPVGKYQGADHPTEELDFGV